MCPLSLLSLRASRDSRSQLSRAQQVSLPKPEFRNGMKGIRAQYENNEAVRSPARRLPRGSAGLADSRPPNRVPSVLVL